jgi:hypothetical protein
MSKVELANKIEYSLKVKKNVAERKELIRLNERLS